MTTQQTQRGTEYRLTPNSDAFTKEQLGELVFVRLAGSDVIRIEAKMFSKDGKQTTGLVDLFDRDELKLLLEAL